MASRNNGENPPERKKARLVADPVVQSVSGLTSVSTKWDWTTAGTSGSQNRTASPSGASDSVSLSGSDTGSQKASPSSTPIIIPSLRVTLPKIISGALIGRDSDSPATGINSALNTPPVIGDLRPFLIRPSALAIDDQTNNGDANGVIGVSSAAGNSAPNSTIGVVAPWQLQDFGDGLAFDASLSGLSDLAAPGCVK